MIRAISSACARQWAASGVICGEDEESYQYGLELLLSTALNFAIMLALSIAVGQGLLMISYLASFIPLRLSAGGYHAKHHFSCILFNTAVYCAALAAAMLIPAPAAIICCAAVCILSLVLNFLFAPVPAKNKPLSASEHRRNRRAAICMSLLLFFLCAVFYCTHLLGQRWCTMLYCGQAAALLLLLMEKAALIAEHKKQS